MMIKEPPEYRVVKRFEPAEIDGDWHKPVWRGIEPLFLGNHMGEAPAHRPGVSVRLAWDDGAVFVAFRVVDRFVRAIAKKHQDPVCRDSCVEFFFTPGPDLGASYFNLEINCGGTMLFWWHPKGGTALPVADEDCSRLAIGSTLPKIIDPEIESSVTWSLECRLPFSVIQKYCPNARKPEPGTCWRGNLYKCADGTSHPHWLTWSFVDHPIPKFHMPEYFGILKFV